jgi:uncharacterized protein (DUF3820 family)
MSFSGATTKIKTFDFILPFGKYKGETVDDIFKKDPQYLLWAISSTRKLQLSLEDKVKIIKKVDTDNLLKYKK